MDYKEIDVKNIEININTNLGDDKQITFTKDLLYVPNYSSSKFATFSKYPFITDNCRYPKHFLKDLSYIQRLRFFFVKVEFEKILKENVKSDDITEYDDLYDDYNVDDETEITNDEIKRYEKRKDILKENIVSMLQLIFPTLYPYIGNINSSFEHIKSGYGSGAMQQSKIGDYLNAIIIPKFSYLKINNKICTIIGVTWLDDVLNNPEYFKLIELMYDYLKWGETEKKKFRREEITIYRKLKKAFDKFEIKKNNIVTEIQKRISSIPKDTSKLSGKIITEKQKLMELNDIIMNKDTLVIGFFYIITASGYKILAEYKGKNNDNVDIFKHPNCDEVILIENNEIYLEREVIWDNIECDVLLNNIKPVNSNYYKNISSYMYGQIKKGDKQVSGNITKRGEKYIIKLKNPYTKNINIPNVEKMDDNKTIVFNEEGQEEFKKRIFIKNNEKIQTKKITEEKLLQDKASNIIKTYESLNEASSSKITDGAFMTLITTIQTETTSFKELKKFADEYLLDDKDKRDNYIRYIKLYVKDSTNWGERFEIFKKTIKEFQNFMGNNIKSSNINLQKLIDDYGSNNTSEGNEGCKFNDFIINVYENNITNNKTKGKEQGEPYKLIRDKYMNISVTDINLGMSNVPSYRIFLNMDFIDGELNSKNADEIKCLFEDDSLSKRFEKLINNIKPTYKIEQLPFIAVKTTSTNEEQPKQGGTRRVRFLIGNRTRKLY